MAASSFSLDDQAGREQALSVLAPQGRLRAAINFGNAALAQRGAAGEVSGVSVDLAGALARELGVPCEYVGYEAAGKVSEGMGQWDVAFLAIDPVRAERLAFTSPYVLISACYMVRTDSPLQTPAEVDAPGHRVGVGRNAAYDLHLTRTLRHAQLVRCDTAPEAFALLESGRVDAAAGVRRVVQQYAAERRHLRVMAEDFMGIEQAVCVPRDALARAPQALAWLTRWVEAAKRSGFVAESLARSGQVEASVAPAA
ncbi:transporter substrate-binding domain-containing protein [Ramlibacter rhizophilus]|uniref:Transporter substrate-binding domain-containing protein n=1 Tax=Ramlibacter rhizophilus TaxID=1781167 RepID=A0A4Z0BKK6_9BURK|nr:transporter substrate-binding domain-containing protein [Ramlibacter rhizophilus]TFY99846.1 transporter substrate-binding domain-containing protein [Ramlibacter rhizophilus]